MRKAIICAALLMSMGCAVQKPSTKVIRLTVTHVFPNGYDSGIKEVWARRGYMVYMAQCENLSDTVKVGTVITAIPATNDTCNCLFKRIK